MDIHMCSLFNYQRQTNLYNHSNYVISGLVYTQVALHTGL